MLQDLSSKYCRCTCGRLDYPVVSEPGHMASCFHLHGILCRHLFGWVSHCLAVAGRQYVRPSFGNNLSHSRCSSESSAVAGYLSSSASHFGRYFAPCQHVIQLDIKIHLWLGCIPTSPRWRSCCVLRSTSSALHSSYRFLLDFIWKHLHLL